MNLLFRPTNPFRLSTPFNTISILSKPTHHTSSTMRNLTPSRTIHAHTHIHRHSTSQAGHRPLTAVALGLGGAIPFFAQGRPTWNDVSPAALSDSAVFSSSAGNNGTKKNVPVLKGGKLNPDAVKQISFGGMLGLGLGVLFSMLSRMLVLVLGIGVVVWQYAARKGYNIIPADRLQRYVKGIDVRSAIHDNVAFKISFGLMFALTAFGEF